MGSRHSGVTVLLWLWAGLGPARELGSRPFPLTPLSAGFPLPASCAPTAGCVFGVSPASSVPGPPPLSCPHSPSAGFPGQASSWAPDETWAHPLTQTGPSGCPAAQNPFIQTDFQVPLRLLPAPPAHPLLTPMSDSAGLALSTCVSPERAVPASPCPMTLLSLNAPHSGPSSPPCA